MPLRYQAVNFLKKILGFGPGKKPGQIGTSADMQAPIGVFGDSQQDSGYNFYARQMQVAQERLQRYREFRNADDDDIISVAVDLYAEDATTINLDTGKSIWPTAKNPEVLKILDGLFERIEVEDIAFPLARELALMGDHFEGVILAKRDSSEPGGVVRLSALDPGGIHRHTDELGRLAGFSIGVQPNEKGATAAPWEYVHWRLLGKERTTEYGWSMLASSRRVYRRLKLMEDAISIYRINRCPDRLIFKMKGMAGLSPQERFRFLTSVRTYMRKKMAMDQEQGQVRSELKPIGIDQDFYIDDDTIAIDQLHGTASVGPILDVDYMRKRLCGCLRIPSDYLGFPEAKGGFMSRSTLCLTGDTKIALADGRDLSVLELQKEFGSKKFWVYSIDEENHRVRPGQAHSVRKTGTQVPVVRVTLDNGESVRCTPDHPFMLRDGSYKWAKDLQPGESLMPLYRGESKVHPRYEEVYDPCSDSYLFTSHLFVQEYDPSMFSAKGKFKRGWMVHHKNRNSRDNCPENLLAMSSEMHRDLHRADARKVLNKLWADPEYRKMKIETNRAYAKAQKPWLSQGVLDYNSSGKQSKMMKELWANEEYRAQQSRSRSVSAKKIWERDGHIRREGRHYGLAKAWDNARKDPVAYAEWCKTISDREKLKHEEIKKDPERYAAVVGHMGQMGKLGGAALSKKLEDPEYKKFHHMLISDGKRRPRLLATVAVLATTNHKVISVEPAGLADVYEITVDKHHNFGLSAGVFVHNSDQDLQFSRQVKNLQRATITGFVRLCQIHLAWIGMDPKMEDNEFEIHMNPVSYLDELQRAELVRVRVETVNALQGLADKFPDLDKEAWLKFLFKVSGFPEEIIQKADETSKELGLSGNVEITEGQRTAAALSRLLMGGSGSTIRNLLSDVAFSGTMSSKSVRVDGVLPLPAVREAREKTLTESETVPLLEGKLP